MISFNKFSVKVKYRKIPFRIFLKISQCIIAKFVEPFRKEPESVKIASSKKDPKIEKRRINKVVGKEACTFDYRIARVLTQCIHCTLCDSYGYLIMEEEKQSDGVLLHSSASCLAFFGGGVLSLLYVTYIAFKITVRGVTLPTTFKFRRIEYHFPHFFPSDTINYGY